MPHLVTSCAVPQSALHYGHILLNLTQICTIGTAQSPPSPATLAAPPQNQPCTQRWVQLPCPSRHMQTRWVSGSDGDSVRWDTDTRREGQGQKPFLFQTDHVHTCASCLETYSLLWDNMVGWGFFLSELGDAELGDISGR